MRHPRILAPGAPAASTADPACGARACGPACEHGAPAPKSTARPRPGGARLGRAPLLDGQDLIVGAGNPTLPLSLTRRALAALRCWTARISSRMRWPASPTPPRPTAAMASSAASRAAGAASTSAARRAVRRSCGGTRAARSGGQALWRSNDPCPRTGSSKYSERRSVGGNARRRRAGASAPPPPACSGARRSDRGMALRRHARSPRSRRSARSRAPRPDVAVRSAHTQKYGRSPACKRPPAAVARRPGGARLGGADLARLDVVRAVPGQQAAGRQAQPDREHGQLGGAAAASRQCGLQQVVRNVEAVHQRPLCLRTRAPRPRARGAVG